MCQSNSCGCDDLNFNGRIFVTPEDNPTPDAGGDGGTGGGSSGNTGPLIDIIGKAPIRVKKTQRGKTTVYEISLYVATGPTTGMDVNPSFVEFNKPFTAAFTVSYAKGSEEITTKELSPMPSPTPDMSTSPFNFNIADTPQQVGTRYTHTFKVTDTENQSAQSSKSIEVYYRYYRGLIPRGATLSAATAANFESGIGPSIQAVFGGKRHYINSSGGDGHFCWLRPVGSQEMGTPVGDGNFPFETRKEGYTVSLNGADYEVIKTVNFYPTSTDVELSF